MITTDKKHTRIPGQSGRLKERHRIHQVVAAPPGTRMMVRFYDADGMPVWEARPVLFFALIEDLEQGGDRMLVPMDDTIIDGVLMQTYDEDGYGMVLAPGEPVPVNYVRS